MSCPKPFEFLEGCRSDLVVMAVVAHQPPFEEPRELPFILGGWKSTRLGLGQGTDGSNIGFHIISVNIYEPRSSLMRNHPISALWSEVLVVCHGRKRMLLLVLGF